MIRRCLLISLVLVLALCGCTKRGVIPARKMASILHDMYILDAQIETSSEYTNMADTSSVYGALFDEYGYSVEDFNRSIDYYLHNPVKFKEIFEKTKERYDKEYNAYSEIMMKMDAAPAEPEVPEEDAVVNERPDEKRMNRNRIRRQLVPPEDAQLE